MGRPLANPRRVSRQITSRMNFVEELRASLPLSHYIKALHVAAMTGKIPKFDPDSLALSTEPDPTGSNIIENSDRLKLLQYLVDKAMPDYRPGEAPPPTIDTATLQGAAEDADYQAFTTDQLRAIAYAANSLADAASPAPAADPGKPNPAG